MKLQLSDGAISQEDYDAAVQEATQNYTAQMNEMNVRVQSFNLEAIAGAWDEQLNDILPDLEGSLSEKLQTAMNAALLEKPEVSAWTQEDVAKWFDLDGLAASNASAFENIYQELKATAEQAPEGVKEEILQNYKESIPTAEEIKAAIDWDSMTVEDWSKLYESITEQPLEGFNDNTKMKQKLSEVLGEHFESVKNSYAEAIHKALEECQNNDTLKSFMEQYMSTDNLAQNLSQSINLGKEIGMAIQNGTEMNDIKSSVDSIKSNTDKYVTDTFSVGASATMPVKITANYKLLNPTATISVNGGGSGSTTVNASISSGPAAFLLKKNKKISGNAAGGYVSGGPQLSWLAEEGWGEFIIPTNPSRRTDAIDLYQKAGAALGIQEHAEGGYVAGSNSGSKATDYNLFSEAIKNAPIGNYEATSDNAEDNPTVYEPVSVQPEQSSTGNIQVPVNVSVSPQFVIEGSGGKSEEDIMAIIRKNMKAMADELGGEIADRLEAVFSNMPTVKEV